MPTAGDEGYEKLVQCPYDKAHEIRKGRMQFHLEKCRRNFPLSQLDYCPYNKGHLVPAQEMQYHMDEECDSRVVWERFTHVNSVECPVKDLVPVNAGDVPDGGENWDNFQATGSVLDNIRAEAEQKPITRMLQVASKAKRKEFRLQERKRHIALMESGSQKPDKSTMSDTASVSSNQGPLPRPRVQPNVSVVKQDPTIAVAAINKQFRTLDINMKSATANTAPSETSSMINCPPSEYETASEYETVSVPRKMPFSYAAASSAARRPSATSNVSTENSSISMMTALTSQRASNNTTSRPSTAMSNVTSNSYATASRSEVANRPPSVMSNLSLENSTTSSVRSYTDQRPPNSTNYRQSTAMSIAASAASYRANSNDEGFCQIPIPGLGRGRRRLE